MRPCSLCLGLLLILVLSTIAYGQPALSQTDQKLVLEVWLNGHTDHTLVSVIERSGSIFVSATDLKTIGVKVDAMETAPGDLVSLAKISGVQARIDTADQRLTIEADKNRLIAKVFDLRPSNVPAASKAASGFIGTYDLVSTVNDFAEPGRSASLGGQLGGTFFSNLGTLTATGFGQLQSQGSGFTRLDTSAEIDEPENLRHWIIGDAISGGLAWSRPVRFAGLQVGTDFDLRPDLATMPLPAFFGQTAVPATVDVYVNSARVFEADVGAGPFQLNNLPLMTGSGQATVVVQNALGQQVTTTLPFFASDALLQEGLSAYNFDVGFLRKDYGLQSFEYGDILMTGTYRLGLTGWFTASAHTEVSKDVQVIGSSADFSMGSYGVVQLASAFSDNYVPNLSGTGALYSASVQTQFSPFSFYGQLSATTGHYIDPATLGGPAPATLQMQLGANAAFGRSGSFGVSWIEMDRSFQPSNRLASASYSATLGNRWYVGATGFYDVINRNMTGEVFVSVALGGRNLANASIQTGGHSDTQEADFGRTVDPDGGFGYRISAYTGNTSRQEAETTWINNNGSVDAAVSAQDNQVAGRLTFNGGVVVMDDEVYATQQPQGAVALVKTGEPGVRIYRENREIAVSDSDGEALLTGLVPYTENRIGIEPADYKLSTVVQTTDETVVPQRQSGVVVDLSPPKRSPVLITLVLSSGDFVPLGAAVTMANAAEPTVVGNHGEVFLADLDRDMSGRAVYEKGICIFRVLLPAVLPDGSIPHVGPIACSAEGVR